MKAFSCFVTACLLTLAGIHPTLAADGHPNVKRAFSAPPSAALDYAIDVKQSGIALSGTGLLNWHIDEAGFQIKAETRAPLFGKILEATSQGKIDGYGLAPDAATDMRLRKPTSTTTFDRTAGVLQFSTSASVTYPLSGGEQDRTSIIWQLAGNINAAPGRFATGSTWDYFVAGPRDAEIWTFKIVGPEKLDTALGPLQTLHVTRIAPTSDKGRQLDVWLARERNWYPVKLRFSEDNGDTLEQNITAINPQ